MTAGNKKWIFISGAVVLCLVVTVLILAGLSGQFLKTRIEKALGDNVKAGAVSLSWGKVTIEGLTFTRDDQVVGEIRSVGIKADFMSIMGNKLKISRVEVDQPRLKLVIDKKGNLLLPVALPEEKTGEGNRNKGKKQLRKDPETKDTALPVEIKTLVVRSGIVEFEDKSVARPVALRFEDVEIDVHDVAYPIADQWTAYEVTGRLSGGARQGSIHATGTTNFLNEETKVKTVMKDVDLVLLRPYVEKKGDVGIQRGFVVLNMDANIMKEHIKAPGTMTIKDLQLASSSGVSGTFLGVPRSMVISFLKNNNNEIVLDFVLEGDLSNPHFNIRENLATRLSVGLANKLGISIMGAGEAVAGGAGKIIEGTTKTLKGLFK